MGELIAQSLVGRIGHMSVSMEDADRHAKLMAELTVHITAMRG